MGPWTETEPKKKMSMKDLAGKDGGKGYGALGQGLTSFADSAVKDDINSDFKTRNAKAFEFGDKQHEVRKKAESAAFASGNPYAMIGAAVSATGRQVDKASKDEFGIYNNKFGEFADNSLDIGNGIEFWKSAANGKQDAEGWANQLSLGLIGKSTAQRDLIKKKKVWENENVFSDIENSNKVGAMIKNSTPGYSAPAYGRRGMKFKTKFTY